MANSPDFECFITPIEEYPDDTPMYEIIIKFGKYSFKTYDGYLGHMSDNSFVFNAANGPESSVWFKYSNASKRLTINIDGDWGSFNTTETLNEKQKNQFLVAATQLKDLNSKVDGSVIHQSPFHPIVSAVPGSIISPYNPTNLSHSQDNFNWGGFAAR